MIKRPPLLAVLAFVVAAGCTTAGADPHDMSAREHAAAASREEAVAQEHQAQVGSDVGALPGAPCRGAAAALARAGNDGACWTSIATPTDAHRSAATEHRRHAADHRAASVALKEAEARVCVGLSEDDRDISPFEQVEDIESVTPLMERVSVGKSVRQERAGAVVVFRAVPGLTAEWLQRVVDCHLARSASLGHVMPEMPNCPLVPKGAEAKVSSAGTGFAVAIRAKDRVSADDILARAQRLLPTAAVSQ
ncbi:MAG: hypothetical protein Q8O67_17230 [Deltaproteobacteria bacterium]|nr:hypothetical protein [Deltaproteobacteria bacterium]